jgi:hypothetical protein
MKGPLSESEGRKEEGGGGSSPSGMGEWKKAKCKRGKKACEQGNVERKNWDSDWDRPPSRKIGRRRWGKEGRRNARRRQEMAIEGEESLGGSSEGSKVNPYKSSTKDGHFGGR